MERQILFNTEMVVAMQEDRKTQTRRLIKPQPVGSFTGVVKDTLGYPASEGYSWYEFKNGGAMSYVRPPCQPGDVLWVRETWTKLYGEYFYKANIDESVKALMEPHGAVWRPSIHMPREAARLFARVEKVWLERLRDIKEEDAIAEGIKRHIIPDTTLRPKTCVYGDSCKDTAVEAFSALWDSIYASPMPVFQDRVIVRYESYPWEDIQEIREYKGRPWVVYGNPSVFAVKFGRVAGWRY